MVRCAIGSLVAGAALILSVGAAHAAAPPPGGGLGYTRGTATGQKGTLDIWSRWSQAEVGRGGRAQPAAEPQPVPTYRNRLICYSGTGRPEMAPVDGWCESGVPLTPRTDCEQLAVLPTWRQWTYPDGTTGDWELLDQGWRKPVSAV